MTGRIAKAGDWLRDLKRQKNTKMAAVNGSNDSEAPLAIESSLKVELKPSFIGSKGSSPAAMHPYLLKSYQKSHKTAKLLHPNPTNAHTAVVEVRDEVLSELLASHAKAPPTEYVPEADKLTTGQPPTPELSAADTVFIGSRQSVPKHKTRPYPQATPRVRSPKTPPLNYPLLFYSISVNIVYFTLTFVLLYLIMQIPGMTGVNSLDIYDGVRMQMVPIPLWLNSGFIIAAVICAIRILLYHVKYSLGLIIGIPVGFNTILSHYMEGFVGNGIVLGFCISAVILLCVIMEGKIRLRPEDTTFVSMVAGLGVIPVMGFIIHSFAALFIGLTVGLFTQIVLLLYVKLRRHR